MADKYKLSKKGQKAHADLCKDLWRITDVNEREGSKQIAQGKVEQGKESFRIAAAAEADAKKFGCKWAQ